MSFTVRDTLGNFASSQWMAYAIARTNVNMPNCFTYATARISEIVGHNQSLDGNTRVAGAGNLWESHAPEFTQSSTATPGALAIYKGGYQNYGHVAVVEVVGKNMAMSQSNYGGAYFQYVEVPKYVGSYYPGTSLRLAGFLVHKELKGGVSTAYSESQLINENGVCTLTQPVKKRRDRPDGIVAETLKPGKKLTYTQKWVGNGHRYVSWVETEPSGNKYRYFVAISGSEKHCIDLWADFGETSTGYNESQLINENCSCTLKVPVNKRRDTPSGIVAETLKAGTKLTYTQKWVGNGHRYVSWVETEPNGNKYRYFVAISGSETQGKALWADFYDNADTTASNTISKAGHTVSTANVKKWGCDVSVHNPKGSVDLLKYDFVLIQSNYGEKTDNEAYKDKLFDYWVSEAKKAGIPFGVYCYDYALNLDGAKLEAEYAVELAKESGATLGVWIDMEDEDKWKEKRGLWTRNHCLSVCETFCDTVQEAGMYTGVYCTPSIFDSWLNSEKIKKVDKWVAEWKTNDGYVHSDTSARGTIHQYSSITPDGKGLDLNVMYVSPDHYKMTDTGTENGQTKEENIKKDEGKEDTKDPVIIPKEEPQKLSDNAKANDNKNSKKNKGDKKKNKKGNKKKSAGMISKILKKIIKILMSTHDSQK